MLPTNRLTRFAFSGLAAATIILPMASAQEMASLNPTAPETRNAALKYWAAWQAITPELNKQLGDVDWTAIGSETDPEKLPEAFKTAAEEVETHNSAITQIVAASKLAKCDFEIAWEHGFGTLLPHLSPARAGARLIRVDARRLISEGQADTASEHIAALLRVSEHISRDGCLISSLVGAAIATAAIEEGRVALDAGQFRLESIDAIHAAAVAMDPQDPYRIRWSIHGEERWSCDWPANNFRGPHAGAAFAKAAFFDFGSAGGGAMDMIALMDEAALKVAVEQYRPYFAAVREAWDRPDAPEALDQVSKRAAAGEFGPLGLCLAPSLSKANASFSKSREDLALFVRKLEAARPKNTKTPAR